MAFCPARPMVLETVPHFVECSSLPLNPAKSGLPIRSGKQTSACLSFIVLGELLNRRMPALGSDALDHGRSSSLFHDAGLRQAGGLSYLSRRPNSGFEIRSLSLAMYLPTRSANAGDFSKLASSMASSRPNATPCSFASMHSR